MRLIEMDLYKYHDKPKTLKGHQEADEIVPNRILERASGGMKLTPKQKSILAKTAKHAYEYALIIGRFPEGEPAILKGNPYLCYAYAKYVLHGRWPEAEQRIASLPYFAAIYGIDVSHRRLPEAEKGIYELTGLGSHVKKEYQEKFNVWMGVDEEDHRERPKKNRDEHDD